MNVIGSIKMKQQQSASDILRSYANIVDGDNQIKLNTTNESTVPTDKQVEAAKAKYDLFGLKIENAKKKAGYSRGTGTVGELQRKKGEAHAKYQELKKAFDAETKSNVSIVET